MIATPLRLRACLSCGQLQSAPLIGRGETLVCPTCRGSLERSKWRSIDAAFALSAATLLMLIPAVTMPLMRTWLLGASREATLLTCVRAVLGNGWPEMALMVLMCAVVLPLLRFTLLTAVLGALTFGLRPAWLGGAFRYATALRAWAMPDVFLAGFVIAFLRLRSAIDVEIGTGGLCLAAAGLLTMFTRAATNQAEVWRAILDDLAAAPAPAAEALSCLSCGRVALQRDEGSPCPRCNATLRRREPYAVVRCLALTIAGALLYIPANLYPMATLPIGAKSIHYTILEGAIDLAQAKLVGLALVVLTASFVIPILKLGAISWCVTSILHRSKGALRGKLRAYRFVEEIGRWSMVDCFVIASFVPVATYNNIIYGRAEPGAPLFVAVVVLTMIAVRRFDPRLMWDAAADRR